MDKKLTNLEKEIGEHKEKIRDLESEIAIAKLGVTEEQAERLAEYIFTKEINTSIFPYETASIEDRLDSIDGRLKKIKQTLKEPERPNWIIHIVYGLAILTAAVLGIIF